MNFEGFGKIPRLSRECIVTEKIDGTNSQICIVEVDPESDDSKIIGETIIDFKCYRVFAGSRNRWITPEDDNFGFAKWVKDNIEELTNILGPGKHFGEWWGSGINRGYGLINGEKKFSLFNTARWNEENKPKCCEVVPQLYVGEFSTASINDVLWLLQEYGSKAAPGFVRPEGVIIYHTAGNSYWKKTLENDEKPKGSTE